MFLDKLQHIKAIILDVDGVLTNGHILVTESGDQLRQFNIKDGYAIQLAIKRGYHLIVLSGGRSKGVELRLKGLGVHEIFLGLDSKMLSYLSIVDKYFLKTEEILYVGDDIPDLQVMKMVGLAACPADAAQEIKAISHYISPKKGGEGCVRDIIEKVLRCQETWSDQEASAHDGSSNI